LTFIHPNDVDLYNAWDSRAFELQVANHELLGHGSGKLFQEGTDGKRNFDPSKVGVLFGAVLRASNHSADNQSVDGKEHVSN
jgi:hypothetical protein